MGRHAPRPSPRRSPAADPRSTGHTQSGLGGHPLVITSCVAGTFEELLLDEPRPDSDCPLHLPEAPPPAKPWDPPPGQPGTKSSDAAIFQPPDGDDDDDDGRRALRRAAVDPISGAAAEVVPQHCSSWHGGEEEQCRGANVPNLKQRRNVRLLAGLLGAPEPDVDAMTYAETEIWIGKHWSAFMKQK